MLLKIGFTSVTQNRPTNAIQNWFHKCYSKLVSQTLLKIGFTNVTQNWFHKRYSKFVSQALPKLVSQTLLKIGFTGGTSKTVPSKC